LTRVTIGSKVAYQLHEARENQMTLKQIAAQIAENGRALEAGELTRQDFDERQREAWDAVARGEERIVGSACARRYMRVVGYLGITA
jgi:L-fucose mutarotase/ribose pyranase (RbsD/FucU family)